MAEAGSEDDALRRLVREEIEAAFENDAGPRRAAIIASKGTPSGARPALILAAAAAEAGLDAAVFFTSDGLDILHMESASKLAGRPDSPPMPNIAGALPGLAAFASGMTASTTTSESPAAIRGLLLAARESGVRLIACETTMDLFGYDRAQLIEGVEVGGAAAFLSSARDADLTLFV